MTLPFRRTSLLPFAVASIAASALAVIAFAGDGASKAAPFRAFAPKVATRTDDRFLYVESDGMPDHRMMVGITAWQQQVPLPQPYRGDNAWRVPLSPVPAADPKSAKSGFFRGAIAIAVNGVPIFNPIKNDGKTDTFLAGELDEFGGHSGRADDYHYHVAPVFLADGDPSKPVAFALDGYPIYGYAEPDGTPARKLDAFNGHDDAKLGYHYHATRTYPYLNGGFHGEVVEREGQVDPQPHAHPVREATSPLPGARITGFETAKDGRTRTLTYERNGKAGTVKYVVGTDGAVEFTFTAPDGTVRTQTYRPDERGGGGGERPERAGDKPPRGGGPAGGGAGGKPPRGGPNPSDPERKPWLAQHLSELDANGDGILARAELDAEVAKTFAGYDRDGDGKVTVAERDGDGVRSAMGGFVKQHWKECDADGDEAVAAGELLATAVAMFGKADRDGDGRLTADELAARGGGGERRRRRDDAPAAPRDGGPTKPTDDDLVHGVVYADNWFLLYVNGKPVAVDPVDFLPHNVVTVDFLPEYPMTIAVLAKDNADPATGLEYGDHVGDAGFILKFADGTVTNATWKAKSFARGPVGGDVRAPRVEAVPLPADWFAVGFDDAAWGPATEYTAEQVRPPAALAAHDLTGAKFIWTADLALDNTVVFRTRIDKPGWTPRWTTKPDLDVRGAPTR